MDDIVQINLLEIFNHQIELQWTTSGLFTTANFTLDDHDYIMEFERVAINDATGYALSFAQVVNGVEIATVTNDTTQTSRLLGVIYNGLKQRLNTHDFDFVVFAAVDAIEKRLNIYNHLLRMASKGFMGFGIQRSQSFTGGKYSLLIRIGLYNVDFKNQLVDNYLNRL